MTLLGVIKVEINLFQVLLDASIFAQFILLILFVFSVWSWSIIFRKVKAFSSMRKSSLEFRKVYDGGRGSKEIDRRSSEFENSPLLALYRATQQEMASTITQAKNPSERILTIDKTLQRVGVVQMGLLESQMGTLATVAAVSPFIGLLGTVWGIIVAFRGIGMSGNANLASVAPGISESLIATALGLVAAIPALMAYNHFQGELKSWQNTIDDFSLEIISTINHQS
ncbi:MAG: MotA/TolQ/ExbB proton channel family protein [Holophagaceae bacterium]